MEDTIRKIHKAILADDVKTLSSVFVERRYLTLSFGRFPVLSLAYMYDARKVIKRFAPDLKRVGSYEYTDEFPEDYVKFKSLAGKALRLYSDKTVSPAEIAVLKGYGSEAKSILDDSKTSKTADAIAELYRVKEGRTVRDKSGNVVIPRSKAPMQVILVAILTIVLALGAMGVTAYAYRVVPYLNGNGQDKPYVICNANVLTELLGSEEESNCTLGADIRLSDVKQTASKLNLDGCGYTIYVDGAWSGPLFSTISGSLKNVRFVFENLSASLGAEQGLIAKEVTGTMSGITVTANAVDLTLNGDGAVIAYKNAGTVGDVTVNLSGTINESSGSEQSSFGCLFAVNSGAVANVTVNLDLSVTGDAESVTSESEASEKGDYIFAGVVGENNGSISSATVNGTLNAVSLDVSAIVCSNGTDGTLTACVNNADITQRSSSAFWNPNVAGIAFENNGKITSCVNNGSLCSISDQTESKSVNAIVCGIVGTNYKDVRQCTNNGALTATTNYGAFRISGICNISIGTIEGSTNTATLTASSAMNSADDTNVFSFAGGISAENYSLISECKSTGDINLDLAVTCLYAGGISAYNHISASAQYTATIEKCGTSGKITAKTDKTTNWLFIGGISGYFAGYIQDCFTSVEISAPEIISSESQSGGTIVDGICGAAVNSRALPTSCYFLSRDNYKYGVCKISSETYSRILYSVEKEIAGMTACETMEDLINSGVYW